MNEKITVHVLAFRDRKNLVMRYLDPATGKHVTRSSGTTVKAKADKAAAKWEAELQEGRYQRQNRMGWQEFVDYAETHYLATLAARTRESYRSTLNVFERECGPVRLSDVTTGKLTHLRTRLRELRRSPATITRHLATLGAILKWANQQGLLAILPDCSAPRGGRGKSTMKGRPITGEEFDRMVDAVAGVVGVGKDDPWKFYLRCLWASGLRLSESLTLRWDERPDAISIDLSGRRPMLRIPAAVEKGKRNRLLPMTPDLAELLLAVPEKDRRGRLFQVHQHPVNVSQVITDIGEAAGVVVRPAVGKIDDADYKPPKFASAHDLRRSFGTRWSRTLSPARLMTIMRHQDISTTMRYYVAEASEELADVLWEGVSEAQQPISGEVAQKTA